MPQTVGTGNTAPGLTSAAALLFVWAALTYAVRAWVKLKKSDTWGVDDTCISASLVLAFLQVVTTCYAVNHGYGNYWSDLSSHDYMAAKKVWIYSEIPYTFGSLTHTVTLCLTNSLCVFYRPDQGVY